MPTFNKVDMMNCCRGWHDFSDGATECLVCGAGEDEASAPNATGLATHHGLVPPPSPSMVAPADPVRDAAPDMLAALRLARGTLAGVPDDAERQETLTAVRDVIAKAEGRANG